VRREKAALPKDNKTMKQTNCVIALMVLAVCSTVARAQTDKPLRQRTIAEVLDSWITTVERHVVPAADAMPEDKYAFAPDLACGDFKGVRTFAQQVKHLAANNYGMAALIQGRKRADDMANETGPDSVGTKAEILAYVKGSFAALHEAVATIDEKNVVQPTASPSQWQKTRLSFAVDALTHSFDHYGQLVEYLRMNGIVPLESRPQKPLAQTNPPAPTLKAEAGRKVAPGFDLNDTEGKSVKLSALKGRVVIVNFWATWCHGCQTEIPAFIEFEKKYDGRGLTIVGISLDDDGWKSVRPGIKEKGVNYPIVVGNSDLSQKYGLVGMPLSVLVDRQGRIANSHAGVVDTTAFEQQIQALLREDAK
jgi:cytochrome c biogenesis protein CcmG/thiol:disulfide interchange protein DsbE